MITIVSVNTFNLYREPKDEEGEEARTAEEERFGRVEQLIRDLDADVIAVQGLIADGTSCTAEKRATSGHHPDCFHPPRWVDRWYATHDVPADAIGGSAVAPVADVGTITDNPAALAEGVR